jgi:MFS family permease
LWLLAAAGGLLFLVQSGTNIHLAAYLRDQGLGTVIAASAISLNAIFTGIGALAWGWAVERYPVRYVFACVALCMAVAAGMLFFADTTGKALASAALFGLSLGGILVVPPVAYANYFGRASLGAIRGTTEPFISLGQAAGAVLSGAIFDVTGTYRIAFLSFVTLAAITMAILLWATPPVRRGPVRF